MYTTSSVSSMLIVRGEGECIRFFTRIIWLANTNHIEDYD